MKAFTAGRATNQNRKTPHPSVPYLLRASALAKYKRNKSLFGLADNSAKPYVHFAQSQTQSATLSMNPAIGMFPTSRICLRAPARLSALLAKPEMDVAASHGHGRVPLRQLELANLHEGQRLMSE